MPLEVNNAPAEPTAVAWLPANLPSPDGQPPALVFFFPTNPASSANLAAGGSAFVDHHLPLSPDFGEVLNKVWEDARTVTPAQIPRGPAAHSASPAHSRRRTM